MYISDFKIEWDELKTYYGREKFVVIPDGVDTIRDVVVIYNDSFEFVFIPNSVKIIGHCSFFSGSNLKYIKVDSMNPFFSSDFQGILYDKQQETVLACPRKILYDPIEIPSNVKSIKKWAFGFLQSKSVEMPNSLNVIEDWAFCCSNLNNIIIPNNVKSIGDHAFDQCKNLESIVLSNNMTTIPFAVFCDCESLKSIVIPNSVVSIGAYAFQRCYSLESVEISKNVVDIKYSVFRSCLSLKSIEIPSSVKSIGNGAFEGCSNLTEIKAPKGLDLSKTEYPKNCKIIRY